MLPRCASLRRFPLLSSAPPLPTASCLASLASLTSLASASATPRAPFPPLPSFSPFPSLPSFPLPAAAPSQRQRLVWPHARASTAPAARIRSLTTAAREVPTLKVLTREFYKLVHPDLFSAHPEYQKVNQKGLSEFMSFVEKWRKRPHAKPFALQSAHTLTFFIKRSSLRPTAALLAASAGEFIELKVTLPHNAPFDTVKTALASLFKQCGLSADFVLEAKAVTTSESKSLITFLNENIGVAQQRMKTTKEAFQQLDALEMKMKRMGVNIVYSPFLTLYSPLENLATFSALHGALSVLSETTTLLKDIKGVGLTWEFDSGYPDIDLQKARIILPREASVTQLVNFFHELHQDKDTLAKLGQALALIAKMHATTSQGTKSDARDQSRNQELQRACELLGVESLAPAPWEYYLEDGQAESNIEQAELEELFAEDERQCEALVNKVVASKKEIQQLRAKGKPKRALRSLQVLVRTLPPGMKHVVYDHRLIISPKLSVAEAVDVIDTVGPSIIENKRNESEAEVIRQYVSVRLGLKELGTTKSFFESVPDAASWEKKALKLMQSHADALRQLGLSGLELAISEAWGVTELGMILIKYDFEMDDVAPKLLPSQPQP